MTLALRNYLDYIRFGLDFFFLHRDHPHIMGLITNDTCNLDCAGCRVANVNHEVMSIAEVRDALQRFYDKGVRMLYLSGGEPYLWRDGKYRLPDIVGLAHDIGYLRVHVYTNGTMHLSPEPDFTWVSIDGFGRTFEKIRGIPVERILPNVREFPGRHAIVCTINTINYHEIRQTLEFFGKELPRAAVMFFFHTPYYGIDHLHLSPAQRGHAVETILDCKSRGFPVLNSKTALETYQSGVTTPHLDYSWIVDSFGEYRCCRAEGDPAVCRNCGYSTGFEIVQARHWRPGAIRALLRTH